MLSKFAKGNERPVKGTARLYDEGKHCDFHLKCRTQHWSPSPDSWRTLIWGLCLEPAPRPGLPTHRKARIWRIHTSRAAGCGVHGARRCNDRAQGGPPPRPQLPASASAGDDRRIVLANPQHGRGAACGRNEGEAEWSPLTYRHQRCSRPSQVGNSGTQPRISGIRALRASRRVVGR